MFSKISRVNTTISVLAVLGIFGVFVSCSSSSNSTTNIGQLKFRAFVSNPVFPSQTGGGTAVLNVMDASKDRLSPFVVSLVSFTSAISDAGIMALSPNHDRTLVMSPRDSKLALVDNVKESIVSTISLPGPSESFFIATDNNTAFVAIPSATVTGQAQGVVEKLNTSRSAVSATIPIPGAHYLVESPNGNQVLVFSDNVDTVVLLTPGLIGASGQPTSILPCTSTQVPACTLPWAFDRPVGAVFDASGSTAFVINCGPECGGGSAGVVAVDMTNTGNPGSIQLATASLPAATTAFLQGTQLYVAGTQVGATAGTFSVLNLANTLSAVTNCGSANPTNCQVFPIADGYHTLMQMGANGQLFIGSRACVNSGVCLSIFDTVNAKVAPTPSNSPAGDVTGIAPIPNRNMVYVCQGTLLRVYDTTTDQLATITPNGQPNVVGQAVDVKVIDF